MCCHGSQWIMAWKLLLRQFHHFIKESGTIAGKGLHLFFPSNQYHYCSCSFKIFAFELKYWACWPNNNSFKDTKVKLAALHMYFDMLISTCTVSCAVHLLTCRSECNTHLLTSLLITSFDLLVSKFPYDCISRSEVCVSVKTTHKADGRHCIYHQNLVVLRVTCIWYLVMTLFYCIDNTFFLSINSYSAQRCKYKSFAWLVIKWPYYDPIYTLMM